ncbi:MAG: putative sugar O-methyltransferase [Planctomycetota bacterium]|nr:putative sugar O-methyltransferase [Planctomycetota bacterium]
MGVLRHIRDLANRALSPLEYELARSAALYPWQHASVMIPPYVSGTLPEGAENYLRPDNPRLRELQERYSQCAPHVTEPATWDDGHAGKVNLRYFRGSSPFVWQLIGRNLNELGFALTAYYVKSIDRLGLLQILQEDGLFGAVTYAVDRRTVSRDLLDSILEIYFLERHLAISQRRDLRILDIGAGYGRLAHRMLCALPNVESYLCTDAVAAATFLCEYYLRFRGLEPRARTVPLPDVEDVLKTVRVDIAVNIHSFSECPAAAVQWWMALLRRNEVPYLFLVPNGVARGTPVVLPDGARELSQVIADHGYRLIAIEPKFADPVVQEYGVSPSCCMLFQRA